MHGYLKELQSNLKSIDNACKKDQCLLSRIGMQGFQHVHVYRQKDFIPINDYSYVSIFF